MYKPLTKNMEPPTDTVSIQKITGYFCLGKLDYLVCMAPTISKKRINPLVNTLFGTDPQQGPNTLATYTVHNLYNCRCLDPLCNTVQCQRKKNN